MTPRDPFPPTKETLAEWAVRVAGVRHIYAGRVGEEWQGLVSFLKDERLAAALDIYRGDVAFHWVVDWLSRWLDRHYPEGTIVCSGDPGADSGAKFTHTIREAIAALNKPKLVEKMPERVWLGTERETVDGMETGRRRRTLH